jgi:hypothetical protein
VRTDGRCPSFLRSKDLLEPLADRAIEVLVIGVVVAGVACNYKAVCECPTVLAGLYSIAPRSTQF